jgi:holo-[acyl-carrier protein] synthase
LIVHLLLFSMFRSVHFPAVSALPTFPTLLDIQQVSAGGRLSVGMDLVQIERIENSVAQFGDRFIQRLFTPQEIDYACATPEFQAERLAARFAAKEAALKALALADKGVAWRDMEVQRLPDGQCQLILHGRAAELVRLEGMVQSALSLSHDGAYAAAIVVAVFRSADRSAESAGSVRVARAASTTF